MTESNRGYLQIGKIYNVPIFFHWSIPLIGVFIFIANNFTVEKSIYYCISFVALILIHELGHFYAAKLSGLNVYKIKVTGVGGTCHSEIPRTIGSALLFYAGGLIAQLFVLAIAVVYIFIFGTPDNIFLYCALMTSTYVNVFIFIGNIIPQKLKGNRKTDGYFLWAVIKLSLATRAHK